MHMAADSPEARNPVLTSYSSIAQAKGSLGIARVRRRYVRKDLYPLLAFFGIYHHTRGELYSTSQD